MRSIRRMYYAVRYGVRWRLVLLTLLGCAIMGAIIVVPPMLHWEMSLDLQLTVGAVLVGIVFLLAFR